MKPPQEGRNRGAPSLRGLQGRSATGLNGQAAKDEVSAVWRGLDAGKYFWRSGREKCFSLDIPFYRTSGPKKAVSAIKISPVQTSVYRLRSACLYLSPDQHCKLHGIVNGRLQLGAWLDGLSPEPNGCNQAGGYEQGTTVPFFRHASQCRRTKSE